MKRHANIPVFIPHLGCPNQCVFCNQRSISGVQSFDAQNVVPIIEDALQTLNDGAEAEIAFFGGSFTGIDRALMISLLAIANRYKENGRVKSIRCSTRPDYIDTEIIEILKKYNVATVELGLQSTDDFVLKACNRGHDFSSEARAVRLIRDAGINLVGQMMVGLPGASLESEIKTAEFIIESGACAARIYPTVVFKETELCKMTESERYSPISQEDAVSRSAVLLDMFLKAGVDVIRIGLCASENLSADETYFAGPNHPALGELVKNELYRRRISEEFERLGVGVGDSVNIFVARGALSKAIGQRKINKEKLYAEFKAKKINFAESDMLSGYDFFIELERENRCI